MVSIRPFDWNAYNAAHGVGRNELRTLGRTSGANNAEEAIRANNSAYSPMAFGNAFLGNNYTVNSSSSSSGIDVNNVKGTGDPNTDAKNFAKKMGISFDEAINQLRAMFGNPEAKQTNDSSNSQQTSDNPFSGNNIDESKVKMTGDPDKDAQNYARKMGISVDEAKTQLKAKYGDPTQKASSNTSSASTTTSKTDSTSNTTNVSSVSNSSNDGSSEFSKNADGRNDLEKTIQYWRAKLKEATDAKDDSGVAYAREQSKKYQTLAQQWDKG